jgi:hypothetical protein
MKTVPLSPNLSQLPWARRGQTTEEHAIICEICERLVEWSEITTREHVRSWLSRIATMAGDSECPNAVWLYLRLSTGDLSQLTASFAELGSARHMSKQAEQQESERAMRVIVRQLPHLADAMRELQRAVAIASAPTQS